MNDKMKKILEYYYNDPKTKELIADLKTVIDEIEYPYTKFNTIIKELARRLYEDNICEKEKISQIIKYLLLDKIKKYKISARWIEECLPRDYKRKYNIKSEQSSLSKKKMSITNEGKTIVVDDTNSIPIIDNKLDYPLNDSSDDIETYEIKEAFRKQQQFVKGDQIFSEETIFQIPKEIFQKTIIESLEKSNKTCFVRFYNNKILKEFWSDTL